MGSGLRNEKDKPCARRRLGGQDGEGRGEILDGLQADVGRGAARAEAAKAACRLSGCV